jgi:hypothetical protein
MLSCCKLPVNTDSGRAIVTGRGYGSSHLVPVIILSIHHSHLFVVISEKVASECARMKAKICKGFSPMFVDGTEEV